MVTDPETLDRIELRRDPNSGKFVGYDPDSGDTFPVPIESLSTDDITSEVPNLGTTAVIKTADGPGTTFVEDRVQVTADVANTATPVITLPVNVANAYVTGQNEDTAPVPRFGDFVVCNAFGSVTVVASTTRNSPAARSYAMDGEELELSIGSDEYDVVVRGSTFGGDA